MAHSRFGPVNSSMKPYAWGTQALYAGRVGGGDPGGPGDPGGSAAGDAQRTGLEEWFAALTADLHLNLGARLKGFSLGMRFV